MAQPKFLGAPVVSKGSGKQLASATMGVLQQWQMAERLIGAVFDTTSSNTGVREGATFYIEKELGHSILKLACRHHTLELHIKTPYNEIMGATSGKMIKFKIDFYLIFIVHISKMLPILLVKIINP